MRVVVGFQDECQEFELAEDCLVGSHHGPSGLAVGDCDAAIAEALEQPRDFPPIAQMFVPGDRVVIVFDSKLVGAEGVLRALIASTRHAIGVEGEITVLTTAGRDAEFADTLPTDVKFEVHDPANREQLAYLATTKAGRRIYLNRLLTDADAVIPVSQIAFDPAQGLRGPASLLFPGMSDQEALNDYGASHAASAPAGQGKSQDSTEVAWLLGSQFSVGLIPGVSGFSEVLAGLSSTVEKQGAEALERDWEFRVDSPAELVVAGIGRPGERTSLEELVAGINAAVHLVQQGGKLVILSRAQGEIGPALRRLSETRDTYRGRSPLKGHEADPDYAMALQLNRVLDWADVYLLSDLDPQVVDDLGIISLDKARNATRLVANSRSCLFLSQAELTRVRVAELEESCDNE